MKDHIVVGTVRAQKGNKYVVVTRDGNAVEVVFDDGQLPLLGGDIVGVFRAGPTGELRLGLKDNLIDAMMSTSTTFMVAGARPDLTARLLAKLLSRQKSAVLSPGSGMTIKRQPHSSDPDLQWALSQFSSEADRLQVALNLIDVKRISGSIWQTSTLRDMSLPADIEGSRRSMHELTRVLRSGFHPEVSRMIENVSGNRDISVNFVMPYSPFVGALGFARHAAAMNSGYFPTVDLSISDTRRLSAVRMIGLAMAHRALGAGDAGTANVEQSSRTRHIANSFADALVAISYISDGGDPAVISAYADLKEASLCFGFDQGRRSLGDGILEDATHRSVRAVLAEFESQRMKPGMDGKEMVARAVRVARRHASPASSFESGHPGVSSDEMVSAVEAANRVAFDLRSASHADVELFAEVYAADVRELVAEHAADDRSASRMITFGANHVPFRMDRVFNRETHDLGNRFDPEAIKVELGGSKDMTEALYDRIRSRRGVAGATDRLQYAEPMVR
jgi:hypothetical protein